MFRLLDPLAVKSTEPSLFDDVRLLLSHWAVGQIMTVREIDGRTTTASHSDVLAKNLPAERFLEVVRASWHIANRPHRVLP